MIATAPVSCCHVVCCGGECQYQAPSIGPELPQVVDASDGTRWVRHEGKCFYYRRPDGGYEVTTWMALFREKRYAFDKFPAGEWTVVA